MLGATTDRDEAQAGGLRRPTLALLALALPMIGITVSRMLMGFIDFVMISWLGTAAQAAVSPATLLVFAISCLGMGIAQGVQTFVSQADGRGEPHRAGGYVWQVLYISLASAVLTLPIAWYTPVWFEAFGRWAGHPPDVRAMEVEYLRIALWVVAPATLCIGLDSFYNGIRRPMIGLTAVICSLVFNAVGNYALIFGKFGFPEMGIAGGALATLLGWCLRAAILITPLLLSRSIDERYHTRQSPALNVRRVRDITRIGIPISMQWLVDIGSWVVFLHVLLPPFGEVAMAGGNIAVQFMHLSFMPALGIGIALTTQVGNAVGAMRPEEAALRVRTAERVIYGYMTVMAVVFVLFGRGLASLLCFEPDAATLAAVLDAARIMLLWVAAFQISDAMCIVYSFAARGAGDTRVPALMFAVCCWGIFVCGGYATVALAPTWGYSGPWAMCTLYIVVLGVLLRWRWAAGRWREIRLFEAAGGGGSAPAVAPRTDESVDDGLSGPLPARPVAQDGGGR